MIESVRGPAGGYLLARKPAELTIGDIVRALEGPIALSHCLEPGESGDCYQADDCVARMVWAKVGAKIEEALDSISFNDLLHQQPDQKEPVLLKPRKKALLQERGHVDMRKVYLDHAATTPVHPKVLEAMLPYFTVKFGNPSNLHDIGREAKNAVEEARAKTAALIGAKAGRDIISPSSGAESNNFALKGLAQANSQKGKHIIVSQIEHFSVLHPAKTLEKSGFTVTLSPDGQDGTRGPRRCCQGDHERNGPGLDHACEQRDRHASSRSKK